MSRIFLLCRMKMSFGDFFLLVFVSHPQYNFDHKESVMGLPKNQVKIVEQKCCCKWKTVIIPIVLVKFLKQNFDIRRSSSSSSFSSVLNNGKEKKIESFALYHFGWDMLLWKKCNHKFHSETEWNTEKHWILLIAKSFLMYVLLYCAHNNHVWRMSWTTYPNMIPIQSGCMFKNILFLLISYQLS